MRFKYIPPQGDSALKTIKLYWLEMYSVLDYLQTWPQSSTFICVHVFYKVTLNTFHHVMEFISLSLYLFWTHPCLCDFTFACGIWRKWWHALRGFHEFLMISLWNIPQKYKQIWVSHPGNERTCGVGPVCPSQSHDRSAYS